MPGENVHHKGRCLEGVDLGHEGVDDPLGGDLADHLAVAEQQRAVAPAGHAHVGVGGLARAVDRAAHHGHGHGLAATRQARLHLVGDGDHVHLAAGTGGAAHHLGAAPAQTQRGEDAPGHRHLLERVGGERHPQGVADALGEQGPQGHGALDGPLAHAPGLGHAQVQRHLRELARERAVRVERGHDAMGFS